MKSDGDESDVVVGTVGQQACQQVVTQLVEVTAGELGKGAL